MQGFPEHLNILVVEDNPADVAILQKMLQSVHLDMENLYSADRISMGKEILQSHKINLVLLDLSLPDSYGIDSFLSIKAITQGIPVIIMTGLADAELAREAIKQGAQDYLVKGEFDKNLLARSIQYSLERKRNLEKLRESNELFNMATKAAKDIIWDWNLVTDRFFLAGDTCKKILGYDIVDSFAPRNFWINLLHPDDKRRVMSKLSQAIKHKSPALWEDEYRLRKTDGEYIYVHGSGYIRYSAEGNAEHMIGAMHDITERKKAEDRIKVSEEKYRQMFYKNPFPAMIFDKETFRIREVNDSAIAVYGYDKDEFLKLTLKSICPRQNVSRFLKILPEAGSLQPIKEKRWKHKKKNGETMIMEVTAYPVSYFGQQAVQAQMNDITIKRQLAKKLARQRKMKQKQIADAVLTAQERERTSIGEELHDNINQILATVYLYLKVSMEDESMRDELIRKSKENISTVMEEIRRLSKALITPRLIHHKLKHFIEELINNIMLVKNMKIELNVGHFDEASLSEDLKINIYRMIQEQLNNIIKHAGASSVRIELQTSGSEVQLFIGDDGKGFDKNAMRKGVGINNIINRAQLYHGMAHIDSEPGKGTSLRVRLNNE